jgi:RHS repeat-associated protein
MPDGGETTIAVRDGVGQYILTKTGEKTGEEVAGMPGAIRGPVRGKEREKPGDPVSVDPDNAKGQVVAGVTAPPEEGWFARAGRAIEEFDKNNYRVLTRTGGLLKATAGGIGMLGGGALATGGTAASATGVGAVPGVPAIVGGSALFVSSADVAAAGLQQAWTGESTPTLLSQAAGAGTEALTGSPEAGKKVQQTVDMGQEVFAGGAGIFLKKAPAAVVPVGEPVSVANGEYLETWHDFLIPGTFELDGARYMGLKLGLPSRYLSPLGPCQISMFDEIFSNPERGKLTFHQSDGKAIGFDRPFNFLPSTNSGYPHLELKAPWLKELRLRDRAVTKHFRQYPDGFYRLERAEELNGYALVLERTEDGALKRVVGADGLALVFENDAKGRRTRIALIGTDGSELELARYAYDAKGRMVSADCAFGMSVRYQWQANADLIDSWHNSTKASETHFTYDESGRVVHTATNGIWNNDRFDYGEGETAYLPGGKTANAQRFQYDEHENITAEIDALGGTVAHRYDSAGFRISTRDANGNDARRRYDFWGNVKEFTDAEGRSTIYGWGDYGELDIVIDGAGNRKTYSHDDLANVISETDAEGHTTRLTRDDKGRIIATQFANGSIETRTWDENNRLTSVTDAKGHVTTFAYDCFNRLIASTDPLGGVTRRVYHAGAGGFAAVSEMIRPDGVTVARSFDGQGQLASVRDGEGRSWFYRNGAFGVLEQITDPKGGVLSFGYDIEGRLLTVTNALGRVYRFARDAAGRVTQEEDFDGRVKRYTRDAAGQVTETLKPDGARLSYGYDKSGLLKRIETFGPDGEAEDVARFWYDGRGLLVQAENGAALIELERDRNGRIIDETVNGQRVKSKRDSSGLRIVRELVGIGGGLTEYVRDPLGAVEQLTSGDAAFTFSRDALGRETQRTTGTGFELMQRFDPAGQLIEQRAGAAQISRHSVSALGLNLPLPATADSGPQARRLYAYDRAFAPVKVDDAIWGETRFAHDGNGQIASADGASGTERFTYDAARNVVGASAPASRAGYGGESYRAVPIDNWTSTPGGLVKIARGPKGERIRLTHDACGRLIERTVDRDGFRPQRWTYTWDAHDRLVSSSFLNANSESETYTFTYDPFGRRITKVRQMRGAERDRAMLLWPQPEGRTDTPAVGTFFLWDSDQLTAEAPLHFGGHVEWEKATHWLYSDEASHTPIAKRLPDGTTLSIVSDHLGTPKEMFDNKGALVWAADHHVWGAVRSVRTSGALALKPSQDLAEHHCPFRFPGQYEDAETGLYYNRHRHYDPLTGQYASPDPIGLAGGDRPQGYVANPGVWTDPLGLAATRAATGRAGLFRGDTRAPDVIFNDGFKPRGTSTDLYKHAKDNMNPPSAYVPTSISIESAKGFSGGRYVYLIDKRVKGVDVNKTLGSRSPYPGELEMAVPNGIPSQNIIGAQQVLPNGSLGPLIQNPNYVP